MAAPLLVLSTVLWASGCGGTPRTASPSVPASTPPSTQAVGAISSQTVSPPAAGTPIAVLADLQAGRVLVQAQCAACHALLDAGISGLPHPVAPALDHIGTTHSRTWLAAELLDPCQPHQPRTALRRCKRMPSFAGLSAAQRDQVVSYLRTRR